MEIRDNTTSCIFAPLSPKLTARESQRLFKEIENEKRAVGIDLKYVYDCTIEFITELKRVGVLKNIGIFNVPSDIFALFNIMGMDKAVKLYVSESDFQEDSRQLLNRKFSVI